MIKKTIKEEIAVIEEVEVEVFETSDGKHFKTEEEAEWHEKVDLIQKQKLNSNIINNQYLAQYIGNFNFVYFENENQVEAYEQKICGNRDNKTWGSWVSCKEKFNFPCWVMCYYIDHNLGEYGGDYTAIYMTPNEVIEDMKRVIEQSNNLL